MYGTQTKGKGNESEFLFENDVKMYGTQTLSSDNKVSSVFENDVKMYGTQTPLRQRRRA